MRIHFIAIGGAAMHNLAIALKLNGEQISGSDDEIFEPSRSRLAQHNILPKKMGWDEGNINDKLDLIILGMHARSDNPELKKAQNLGLKIMSYPEFIFNRSRDKKRVVIAGSHGKTSTTSMILHVLKTLDIKFDFMVGAKIKGFETMVQLSDAPLIILEGDEYFSSPIDMKAKFLWYSPDLALITGISWDHINVYPTKELYNEAFTSFIDSVSDDGSIIYFEGDEVLKSLVKESAGQKNILSYKEIDHQLKGERTVLQMNEMSYGINIFGKHNLQNLQGARLICNQLGIKDKDFAEAITSFEGAANRLELMRSSGEYRIFKDFAHSPSKLSATVSACKEQFGDKKLLALMELHTFSSLSTEFLKEYANSMDKADKAIIYYNTDTIKHKKLEDISESDVKSAFKREDLEVITDNEVLKEMIQQDLPQYQIFLIMTSGNFGGIDIREFESFLPDLT